MSAFAITKAVPLPQRRTATESRYPVSKMEVGDSFFVPGAKKSTQIYVLKQMKNLGFKGATRKVQEDYVNDAGETVQAADGLRVWRTA